MPTPSLYVCIVIIHPSLATVPVSTQLSKHHPSYVGVVSIGGIHFQGHCRSNKHKVSVEIGHTNLSDSEDSLLL